MLPGPSIQVCEGDEIIVNVQNELYGEPTSIHWHGITQKGTPSMDGVSMLTQSPILPQTSFQYRFKANDPGTHMWHAHTIAQRSDGIFGSLIVRPYISENNSDMYDFDLKENVIILNDWIRQKMSTKLASFVQDISSISKLFVDTILINGKGKTLYKTAYDTNIDTPQEIFTVTKDFKYRFRLINVGNHYCPMEFSIEKHILTVISTDGIPIHPQNVSSIVLLPGEQKILTIC